jgi:hypothetical protein
VFARLPIRRAIRASCLATLAVTVVACVEKAAQKDSAALQVLSGSAPSSAVSDFAGRGVGLAKRDEIARRTVARERQAAATMLTPSSPPQAVTGMVIRNGDVSVQVDSLEIAIERVRLLASSLGGSLGNVSINTGEHQIRSATLEMKVPSARFDDAMHGMAPLGKVERSVATAQDVGEEFVDVTARIANAKRLESRLVALLTTRTGKLEDVLAVERELARVREEIERYEGRMRYLSSRIAVSTIVATVHEKAPLVAAQPGTNVIGHAFLNMWRNFVAFLAIGIESLGVVIPLAALAWLLAWRWRRWRAARVTAAA